MCLAEIERISTVVTRCLKPLSNKKTRHLKVTPHLKSMSHKVMLCGFLIKSNPLSYYGYGRVVMKSLKGVCAEKDKIYNVLGLHLLKGQSGNYFVNISC